MANHPKKMADPTEAALSAIQEALNIHDEDEQPIRQSESADLFSPPAEQAAAASDPAFAAIWSNPEDDIYDAL